jgi:hypothetical protein
MNMDIFLSLFISDFILANSGGQMSSLPSTRPKMTEAHSARFSLQHYDFFVMGCPLWLEGRSCI